MKIQKVRVLILLKYRPSFSSWIIAVCNGNNDGFLSDVDKKIR